MLYGFRVIKGITFISLYISLWQVVLRQLLVLKLNVSVGFRCILQKPRTVVYLFCCLENSASVSSHPFLSLLSEILSTRPSNFNAIRTPRVTPSL